ncbi:hypothetical protein ASPVEDRAFT_81990 [Aspergillus versicolor CBS 583.65]|uniref:Uncharacterized protein n=1 Tax=Aspergillus versicolor CBS 583.65 TaxID=1036611 RepID=A0A1L9PFV2_ASPVE|nr:uncharacterized protein ASPVEDRAFT_81990 [Aspergillus versicolor CBS 583.65]OJJ00417.1 hypothetical protein ASPVEDRAFT_81990 [Aspergillus versicolor CBS 583.65]
MSCARELSIGRSRKELGGIRREYVSSSLSHLMGLLGWLSLDKESGQAPQVVGWVWQAMEVDAVILDRHQEEKEEEQGPMRKSPSVCWERDDELMRREAAHQQEADRQAAAEINGPQASVGGAQTWPGSAQRRPALFWTANVATIRPITARGGWLGSPVLLEGSGRLALRCCLTFVFGMVG